jgi:hypothetical protein
LDTCRQAGTGDPALVSDLVGLLADAEAKDGDGSVPRTVQRFQVYPRETRGSVEPDAVAEQHRKDIHTGTAKSESRRVIALREPWGI